MQKPNFFLASARGVRARGVYQRPIKSQATGNNPYQKILEKESEELYKAACAAMTSNPGQPVLVGYPFKKGDSTLCIDAKKAEECGI